MQGMPANKILIIEDDPVGRHILHTALKAAKFETAMAGDAMLALTQARQEKPDLIVLDLGLPAGGGFIFLHRLRMFPALAVIPVLVVSGLDRAVNEQAALDAGAAAYLEKPATPDVIIAKIREILGE